MLQIHVPKGAEECVLQGYKICGTDERIGLRDWGEEKIFEVGNKFLTRESLLWIIRDKEGVAHFDASISSCTAYSALLKQGHEDFYYQRLVSNMGIRVCFRGSFLPFLKEVPPSNYQTPQSLPERYPLLGGIDGVIRTMATEIVVALDEWSGTLE